MTPKKRETVADYLTYLEQKGVEIGYFELHEIKDIDKSCCGNAKTLVIDFDKTKEKIVSAERLITTKSCDCLKIRPSKQCIDLIEMKSFAKFVEHFKGTNVVGKIDENVKKYDLHSKIDDSLLLLNLIIVKAEFGRTTDDIHFFRDTKINYILLTDVDSINQSFNYIALNFIFLGQYSDSIESYIETKLNAELQAIPNMNYKLNKPMLKTCGEIDAYYAQ